MLKPLAGVRQGERLQAKRFPFQVVLYDGVLRTE